MNAKKFYINGRFPTHSFNIYAYWNSFMYKLYRNRKNDIAPLIVTMVISFVLLNFVILKPMASTKDKDLNILQYKTRKHNSVAQIATKHNRDYVTPEDISEAFKIKRSKEWKDKVRLDVLEIMSNNTGFSMEARDLCAFTAFQGK